MKIQALWMSVSAVTLGWCGVAAAQTVTTGPSSGELAEVVVTAERRHTDLQQTPISATVLSGGDLASLGVFTIDQLQFATPGAVVNNFGQGNDFNIRGVGKGNTTPRPPSASSRIATVSRPSRGISRESRTTISRMSKYCVDRKARSAAKTPPAAPSW